MKQLLLDEIPAFKAKGEAFLSGEMKKLDFKRASGGFGIYAERDGKHFMIRLRTLSGGISKEQLLKIEDFAVRYKVPIIHLTTRQAVQFHNLSLDDVCNIMKEGIECGIYTRGGGGNFPRNVAVSPLSGVDTDEVFDVFPYALAANNYFMERITTYHLPRKLKVSFSSNAEDAAHCTVQDLGFVAEMQDGKPYFRIYSGGGLGRNPRKAIRFKKLHEVDDMLYILEAMVQFFKDKGNYENHNKARVRYIADELGDEVYESTLEEYIEAAKAKGGLELKLEVSTLAKAGKVTSIQNRAVKPQKQEGLYSYYFHPVGGQLELSTLQKVNKLIAPMQEVSVRLAMEEGFYLINLDGDEVQQVAKALDGENYITGIECSRSCIGVPICQMGLLESQKALRAIVDCFEKDKKYLETLPPFYISGCGNSCSTHQIGHIGLMGKRGKVGDSVKGMFEVYMDGSCKVGEAKLGVHMGDVAEEYVGECFKTLAEVIDQSGMNFRDYIKEYPDKVKAHIQSYLK